MKTSTIELFIAELSAERDRIDAALQALISLLPRSRPKHKSRRRKLKRTPSQHAIAMFDQHKSVTAGSLADFAGIPRTHAGAALTYLAKKKEIRRVKPGVFVRN